VSTDASVQPLTSPHPGLPRTLASSYMRFAKTQTSARYNLANSGVADCTLADLEVSLGDLALHGPNAYGFGPLVGRIAERFAVSESCVVTPGGGCSFANHLAMSALISPGDEVLVEEPTYELLTATLGLLGARVRAFQRRPEDLYRLDPEEIGANLSRRTRLLVITNLHNPTGALASPAEVAAVARAASAVGARVLVDEVYLEGAFHDGRAHTAFTEHGNIIVTSSLTKAYGLSGLRCGWILAPADLAERMRRLNDLYGVAAPHIAECLAVVAFDQLDRLRARAEAMVRVNRAAYRALLGSHPGLEQVLFDEGTTAFPRVRSGDGDALFERLIGGHETRLTPGRFFNRPDHVRISLGGEPAATFIGLQRVALALNEGRA
jgi:aspartate/methionine/tyrosine aminotransferase